MTITESLMGFSNTVGTEKIRVGLAGPAEKLGGYKIRIPRKSWTSGGFLLSIVGFNLESKVRYACAARIPAIGDWGNRQTNGDISR